MTRTAGVVLVIIGMDVFIVQPGFVQGLVDHGGFTPGSAGYVAAAEMFGIALATILMTMVMSRVDWRQLAGVSLFVAVTGNVVSAMVTSPEIFTALRFVIGVGSGVLISAGYATVGLGADPDRDFGWLIVWVLTYSALMLLAMPTVFQQVGVAGVMVVFALLALAGIPLLRWLPRGMQAQPHQEARTAEIPAKWKMLLLAGLHCYFLAQGVVWAYLSLIGMAAGVSEQQVATGLTVSQVFGIAGALTAAVVVARIGRIISLLVGVLAGLGAMACMQGSLTVLTYGAAVGVFNYAANFVTPLLMANIAAIDRSGRLVVHAVALQMLGLAIGPALAAALVGPGEYARIIWLSMVLFGICLAFSVPPLRIFAGSGVSAAAR